jgi:hypothetical protein
MSQDSTPEDIPVHDWQIEELARRKADLLKHPGTGLSWDEVQRRVRSPRLANPEQAAYFAKEVTEVPDDAE